MKRIIMKKNVGRISRWAMSALFLHLLYSSDCLNVRADTEPDGHMYLKQILKYETDVSIFD